MSSLRLIPSNHILGVAVSKAEAFAWYFFLGLLLVVSFLFDGYDSMQWILFSCVFYSWLFCYLIVLACGGQFSSRAIRSAWTPILILSLSILWLWLSLNISVKHNLYGVFETSLVSTPAWFEPSFIWSVTPERTYWLMMSEVLFFCLFISVLALVDRRRRLKQILIIISVVGVLHAGVGLIGKVANVLFVDAKQIDGHFSAVRGFFVNRNHFGAFISLSLVGVITFQLRALRQSTGFRFSDSLKQQLASAQILIILALVVLFVAIISSESRGALLSLVASLCIVGMVFSADIKLLKRPFFILSMIVFALALINFGQELMHRFASDKLSLGERYQQWQITVDAITQNPWFGYGGGSYGTVFQIFRGEETLRQVYYAQSHNHYLHLWLERGLVGLGLWLAMIAIVVKHAIKMNSRVKSTLVSSSLIASLVVIIAALIQSLVDFNLQMLNIRAYFMVILAIIFAAPRISLSR